MNENHVHVEREKTKRTLIVVSAITLVGLVCSVLFFQNIDNRGGTLKVTKDGVEVSLEKPIVNQVDVDSTRFKVLGDTISVKGGMVTNIQVEGGQDSGGFVGRRFNGQNLIDTTRGFVLASDNPDKWQVQTPSEGAGVVGRLTSPDGSIMEITSMPLRGLPPLEVAVTAMLDSLKTVDPKANARKVDDITWMIWHTNPVTKQVYCMKIVDANRQRYFAVASSANPAAKAGLVRMVADFVVIEKRAMPARSFVPGTKRLQR